MLPLHLLLIFFYSSFNWDNPPVKDKIEVEAETYFYLNCKNIIRINLPKGENYSVIATTTHGAIIKKSNELFFAVPKARTMEVYFSIANAQGIEVDFIKRKFDVIEVPVPDLTITQNDVEVDFKNGISIDQLSQFEIKIIPNKSFAKYHPEDTKYRVYLYKVYLFRGSHELQMTKKVQSDLVDLSSFRKAAQPGDRIFLMIESLLRMNFRGRTENISLRYSNKFNLPIY